MKTVFFTGATGGLGEVCVRSLSARGWTVFAAGTNVEKLSQLSTLANVIPIQADVTSTESMTCARHKILQTTDQLDAVVNFAGLTALASAVEGDVIAQTQYLLDVNVMGTVRTNALFFDMIKKGRGRILNCSSSAGWMTAQPFNAAYVLSKRAIEGYSDSLRRELMFLGIPVIKIQPGTFRTKLTNGLPEAYEKMLTETTLYHNLLQKMRPLMDATLNQARDPETFANVVIKALEAKHPKSYYRKGSALSLLLLELLPESWVDKVYLMMFKKAMR